jgi:hypothetical protein
MTVSSHAKPNNNWKEHTINFENILKISKRGHAGMVDRHV